MRILRTWGLIIGLAIVLGACASGTPTTGPGQATSAPPAGTGVPAQGTPAAGAQQQIAAGQQVYSQHCTVCHGADLQGVSGPALTQTYVASFGLAKDLVDYISKQMPLTAPGSLSKEQDYAVAAYILDKDGLLPAGTTLTPQNVATLNLNAAAPTPTGPAGPPSSPTPAQQAVVHVAQVPSVGSLLVTSEGFTLYQNSNDGPAQSSCTGPCSGEWPPLTLPQGVQPLLAPGIPGSLGVFQRPDGSYQVTYSDPPNYDRVPLYTYFADMWAGDRNGNLLLGTWSDIVLSAVSPVSATGTGMPGQGVAAMGVADYLLNCSSCHGPEAQGVDGPPLRNSNFIQTAGDQAIATIIAQGMGNLKMPAWLLANGGPLNDVQIGNIVAYLHTLQGVAAVPQIAPPPPEPTETPLPAGAPTPEPARPSESGGPGEAANIVGAIDQGRPMFGAYCAACHGPEGIIGVSNPDSDDMAVPPLNPIDPTIANPDPKTFAYNVDLFVQNGSIPEGEGPLLVMPPFGASNMLTQQQIADLIAYTMSLNGVTFGGTPASSATATPAAPTATPPPQATAATSPQVTAGQQVYTQECAMCHGANLQGVSGPQLTQSAVSRFGNAGSLLDYISRRMPLTAPGSLSAQQYDDLTAFILDQDGLLPAGTTVTAQNAGNISLTAP